MNLASKIAFILLFLISATASADTYLKHANLSFNTRSGVSMSIDTVAVPKGFSGQVNVPVKVKNFKNIGAVSLKISFDPAKIQFASIANIAGNAKFLFNEKAGIITIGWYDVTPANLPDGKYFDLVFQYNGTSSPVAFKTESCEIADASGNIINTAYSDGLVLSQISSVKKGNKKTGYYLENNFPNPFNPVTRISYSIPMESRVTLKIFNILGTEIATLVNKLQPAGSYYVDFHASSLPSGIYVYTMQAGDFIQSSRMTLLR